MCCYACAHNATCLCLDIDHSLGNIVIHELCIYMHLDKNECYVTRRLLGTWHKFGSVNGVLEYYWYPPGYCQCSSN